MESTLDSKFPIEKQYVKLKIKGTDSLDVVFQADIDFDPVSRDYVFTLFEKDGSFKSTRRYPQSSVRSMEYVAYQAHTK